MVKANQKQKKLIKMLKQFENDKYVQKFNEQIKDINKIFHFINLNYIQVHCFHLLQNNPDYHNFYIITRKKARALLGKMPSDSENVVIKNTILVLENYLEKEKYYIMIFMCLTKQFGSDLSFLIFNYL